MLAHGYTPAGMFFCSSCFCKRDFILCLDVSAEAKNPPIECYVCGHVYAKTVNEVDMRTGERLPPNLATKPTISEDQRETARAELRADFMTATLRDGYRRENFTGVVRRGRGPNDG